MPENMRRLAADKIVAVNPQGAPVAGGDQKKPNKYHNVPTEVNGIKFDSRKEARRYAELMAAAKLGLISDLRLQRDFTLQEAYTTPEGIRVQAIRYKADFTYKVQRAGYDAPPVIGAEDIAFWRSEIEKRGRGCMVVEDVKSRATKTKVYVMKRKMMADHGYSIREV